MHRYMYVAEKVNVLRVYALPYIDHTFLYLRPLTPTPVSDPLHNTYVHSWTPVGKLWA